VVVRARDAGGQLAEVTLDCAGAIDGWQPVGDHEFTWVALSTGNFQGIGGCSNGAQRMESAGPFGVTVWGWGSPATGGTYPDPSFTRWVSYAYPAAAGVLTISEVPK
jgi:hypothetical protein